jgi:septal ring factor EnvC (AmiA/AmiB activator)
MKTIVTFIICSLLTALGLFAQKPLLIYNGTLELTGSTYPGIIATIPEVAYELVQKNWIKTIESGTKSKAVYDNGKWTLFGANIASISPTPMNVYSKLENQDSLVRLVVAMELKKDDFIQTGTHEPELASAREFLKQFAKEQYLDLANGQLKAEEKKLKEIEKEFSSYGKQQAKLEKAARSAEKTIKSEQEKLVTYNTELNNMSIELASQTMQYNELAEGPAKEEREKYLKSLEKRKTKITKGISSSQKKIDKANNTIRDSSARIPGKETKQDESKDKIAIQLAVVNQFRDKLKKIEQY